MPCDVARFGQARSRLMLKGGWGLVFYQLGEVCDVEVFSLSPFLSLKFADFGRRLADVQ